MREDDDQLRCIEEAQECRETLRFKNFKDKTEFGWVFPEVDQEEEAKITVVVDSQWLATYNDEILELSTEIKKLSVLSFRIEGQNNFNEKNLDTNITCKKAQIVSDARQNDNPTENLKSEMKKNIPRYFNKQRHNDYVKSIICSETSWNDSGLEDSQKTDSMEVSRIPHEGEIEVKTLIEETHEPSNELETRSVTPQSEACYSMLSCASRDSGVYATDDVAETSILEELKDVFSDHELSLERCVAGKLEPVEALMTDDEQAAEKCPIWFQKFSGEDDLTKHLRSLAWNSDPSPREASAQYVSSEVCNESASSICDTEDSVKLDVEEASENTQRRKRLTNLLTKCDRLQTLSPRDHPTHAHVDEVTKLVRSFSNIDDRLQDLRYGLQHLTSQAHKNKQDFSILEDRALHLLTSTAASRRHMAQMFALQKLEDRLQEEWWAAYNPNFPPQHENYIV